jgi:hypothetical protein
VACSIGARVITSAGSVGSGNDSRRGSKCQIFRRLEWHRRSLRRRSNGPEEIVRGLKCKTMKLPPDVIFHSVPPLFVWKPRGVLDEKVVNRVIVFIGEQEAMSKNPFLRFADLTAIDTVELNFKYVFHIALYRRLTYATHPATKAAFLVTEEEAAHFVKLHAMLTDHSALKVAEFKEIQAAAKWLGVPCELLEMPRLAHEAQRL